MKACQDSRFKERLFAYQRLLGGVFKCLSCRRSALPAAQLLALRWVFCPPGPRPSLPVGLI